MSKRVENPVVELFVAIGSDGVQREVVVTQRHTITTMLDGSDSHAWGMKTFSTDRGEHVNVDDTGVMTIAGTRIVLTPAR